MARSELPPPLPPETRTVGQLVAEAIRLYGARFWPSLALGIGPALLGIAAADLHGAVRDIVVLALGLLVPAPVFVPGAAVLNVHQAPRVESGPRARRRRNGDLHSSFEPDGAGRADVEVEP